MATAVYNTEMWCRRGHFNCDQADKYADLCEQVKPRFAIETGFCTGRSAACVLQYSKDCLQRMVSIDKSLDGKRNRGRRMAARLAAEFPIFSVIERPSQDVLNGKFFEANFPHGIDFATIDGDHTYEGCMFDLLAIASRITPSGVVVVDDYKSSRPNGVRIDTVTQSVDSFLTRFADAFVGETWNRKGKGFCIIRRAGRGLG